MIEPVDRAYAELSLRVGLFAGVADDHLGGTQFGKLGRINRWRLTEQMLNGWKQDAIRLGVPAEDLELTAAQQAELPRLVDVGIAMQQAIDAANPAGVVRPPKDSSDV